MILSRHIVVGAALLIAPMSAFAADGASVFEKLEQSGVYAVSQPKGLKSEKHPDGLSAKKVAKRTERRTKKGKAFTLVFDDTQTLNGASESLQSTLGQPSETFEREHVWYVDNPYRTENGAKIMTLQLKTNRQGQLVLKVDGRNNDERDQPLVVGPEERFSKKSRRIAKRRAEQTKRRATVQKPRKATKRVAEKYPL